MATLQIAFARYGGHGILTMSKILAHAGMDFGLNVSWLPSFAAEMRGEPANCAVIISDDIIGSPVLTKADIVVAMNNHSLKKYFQLIVPNGVLIVDSNLVNNIPYKKDINIIKIPAHTIAREIGNEIIANMVLLSALVEKSGIVSMDSLLASLKTYGKEKFFELNKLAIERGSKLIN